MSSIEKNTINEVKEAIEVAATPITPAPPKEAEVFEEAEVIKAKAELLKSTMTMYAMTSGLCIIVTLLLISAFFVIYPEVTGDEIELSDDTLHVLRIIKDIIASIVKFVV